MSRSLSLIILLSVATIAHAQPEPLVAKVKKSVNEGVRYLVNVQRPDGSWDHALAKEDKTQTTFSGGSTGLAVLALLNCDGVIDEPALEKQRKAAIEAGLNSLRAIKEPNTVYVRALQTMAFAEAKTKGDLSIVKANAKWLIDARAFRERKSSDGTIKKELIGWDYNSRPNASATDRSNSQYAMLALWYARQAGVEIPRDVWESIHDYYRRTQGPDGSWNYSDDYKGMEKPSVTMTMAGLSGLLIAGAEINGGREQWANGKAKNCGVYPDDDARAKALTWLFGDSAKGIRSNFKLDLPGRTYYHLYGLERAGRLSGLRFFGEHDWYREGCKFLVKEQAANGSWGNREDYDRWPHINTSFALLFLSKGRTPVLISKLVHGNWPRREDDTDWNNDRNDLRHLTEYLSRDDKLFGKSAVAWQTYDIMRALHARSPDPVKADEDAVVADMRQSPVLYITGHQSPRLRIKAAETAMIKRFIENGGFIFAEACCGDADFDKGFKAWVKDTWDADLQYLEGTDPVWTSYHTVTPGDPFKLMALRLGCRTVMIYSPQDLSCHWESNQYKAGVTQRAFELGANIVAYATGRTPPQPRLTPVDIAIDVPMKEPATGGAFRVTQIRHGEDWPAPKAIAKLMEHVHKQTGLDVLVKPREISLREGRTISGSKFLYWHGKYDFRVDAAHLESLRFTLENGGLLLADACCGSPAFDKAFRKFVVDLFPKEKLERVAADAKERDRLFGAKLNGEAISADNIKCRTQPGGKVTAMEPFLEGIKIDGRWVVLYSKYDIGCALEGNTSADCVGYDHVSALRIATAAVRYNSRP